MVKRPNPAAATPETAAAPEKAPRKTKAAAAPVAEAPAARGRGPAPETVARLEKILARTKEEPGVPSAVLAAELQITSLQCSQLTDRLVKTGEIEIFKLANGIRTNYLPKDLAKVRAKLEKQRDADIADRETNGVERKKASLEALKEKKAAEKKAAAPADEAPAKPARKRKPAETVAA